MWGVPHHAVRSVWRIDLFEHQTTSITDYGRVCLVAKLTKANDANTLIQYGVVPWSGNWGLGLIWTFGGQLIELSAPDRAYG